MAKTPTAAPTESVLHIEPLKQGVITLRIIGETPLYQNRMAAKAKRTLLVGGQKKGKADRAQIKHSPEEEYRDSAEILSTGPTALGLKVIAIKAAMATAALDTPGLRKTEAQRLLFMPGDHCALYGTPYLKMDVVRSADINRTPDIRSRAYLPVWGAEVSIRFVTPQLSAQSVVNLLCNAGILVGVGDYRQEKGKGSFGSFRVLGEGESDPAWDDLVANHARAAQEEALRNPEYADSDTVDLMEYFHGEVKRRAA
ncbi:MAG: hypothetical protein ABWY64_22620 [Tardiphaga sp.]